MIHTHYDNLQIARNASNEVIKGAYRYLSQKWHPDKFPPEKKAQAERYMSLINAAYAVLSDPAQRREHDEWIAQQEGEESQKSRQAETEQRDAPSSSSTDRGASREESRQPAGMSQEARDISARYIARGLWPWGLLWGFVSFSLVVGVAMAVFSGLESWGDAHPGLVTLGMLFWSITTAQGMVGDKKKKLLNASDDALMLMHTQSSRRRAMVIVTSVVLLVGGAVALAILYSRAEKPDARDASAAKPNDSAPADAAVPTPLTQARSPAATAAASAATADWTDALKRSQEVSPPNAPSVARRPIHVANNCDKSLVLKLAYKTAGDREGTYSLRTFHLDPRDDGELLVAPGDRLLLDDGHEAYWAARTDDDSITWTAPPDDDGAKELSEDSEASVRYRRFPTPRAGRYDLSLACNK